jgi:hypothetical protein
MSNGVTDQDPGEEDRQKGLYTEEEEERIRQLEQALQELAEAGELDAESYRETVESFDLDVLSEPDLGDRGFAVAGSLEGSGGFLDDFGLYDFLGFQYPDYGDRGFGGIIFDPDTDLPVYDPTDPVIFERSVQMPDQEVGGGGPPRRPTTTTTPTTDSGVSDGIYGPFPQDTGTGVRQITLPTGQVITVPENLNPFQLLTQGLITREIYEQLAGDRAIPETTPDLVQPTEPTLQETGDPLRRQPTDTETPTDTEEPIITDIEQTVTTPEISDVSDLSGGGLRRDMNEEEEIVDPGDPTPGNNTGPGNGTTPGPDDGGNGGEGFDYEKFFQMLTTVPAFQSGAAFEAGEVPGIYPTAIGSLPQATAFIQSMLELDRAVSPQQAETALDLYRQITGGVREAQSPLMQSLAQRSEQLGAQAERLMGPLSFLEERGATQAGYGQAAALGREIDPLLREQQAGRLREEQRNINLQLAGNLLGQQRATAGLMADIESGIYGRMAPDIGVDPGQILGIAGTDIQNILGEQAARQYSEAIREGSRREQQAQLLETGIGLIPKNFITFGGVEKEGGFTIPGTGITIGGTTV